MIARPSARYIRTDFSIVRSVFAPPVRSTKIMPYSRATYPHNGTLPSSPFGNHCGPVKYVEDLDRLEHAFVLHCVDHRAFRSARPPALP